MSALHDTMPVEQWSGKDRGDENFPVGSALISARLRPHVHAYYAFARNADDIADSSELSPGEKCKRLDAMKAALGGDATAYAPSAVRLRDSLAQTGVDARHATDLLIAFRTDSIGMIYRTWDDLMGYCANSAMPVGRYVLDLHGEDAKATHPPSDALCASLQVLNHLQDCAADLLAIDRCYIPADMLAAEGSGIDDLRRPATTPGLRRVLDRLLDRVDVLNATAKELPRRVADRRLRLETAVIVGLAHRLARRLRAGDPLATRVKLTRVDAAASVLGAMRFLP